MSRVFGSRAEKLQQLLKARTRNDGTARLGYEQNVAAIRAELTLIQERIARATEQ